MKSRLGSVKLDGAKDCCWLESRLGSSDSGTQLSNMEACSIKSAKDTSSTDAALTWLLELITVSAGGGNLLAGGSGVETDATSGTDSIEAIVSEEVIEVASSVLPAVGVRMTSNKEVCSMRLGTSSKSRSATEDVGGSGDSRRTLGGRLSDKLRVLGGPRMGAGDLGGVMEEPECKQVIDE